MTQEGNPGSVFRALHQRDGAFVLPNPRDVGSARILAELDAFLRRTDNYLDKNHGAHTLSFFSR